MKSINIKKAIVVLLIVLAILSISSVCFASMIYAPNDISPKTSEASDKLQDVSGILLGVAQVIGIAVAVIMLVVLAIKYLSAAPGEKADIKKSAFTYVIGALLLFGGVALLNIIQKAGEEAADQTACVVYSINEVK